MKAAVHTLCSCSVTQQIVPHCRMLQLRGDGGGWHLDEEWPTAPEGRSAARCAMYLMDGRKPLLCLRCWLSLMGNRNHEPMRMTMVERDRGADGQHVTLVAAACSKCHIVLHPCMSLMCLRLTCSWTAAPH